MKSESATSNRVTERERPYKLLQQVLCITAINFQRQSLIGLVELTLNPIKNNVRIRVNDVHDSAFTYNDPTMEICQDEAKAKQRNLDYFSQAHLSAVSAVDGSLGYGEVSVRIPSDVTITADCPFRVAVEFSLERPAGGMQFVVPDGEGSLQERAAHCFTYGWHNSSRLWFPCIDTFCDPCTWKMEFTVDSYLTVVAPGDLVEVVFTPESTKKKTFHYSLTIPTSAPNIAVAIGPFDILVDPNMHEVTHFCLPQLLPQLRQSTSFLHEAFEFYEELLSTRYPYSCYKQVFVAEAYEDVCAYSSMSILSTSLLHTRHIIEQTYVSRRLMASAVASQFFGAFISPLSWSDVWLPLGITSYLTGQYSRKAFGNNEYRYHLMQDLEEVCSYEVEYGGVVLDSSGSEQPGVNFHFPVNHLHTLSPTFLEIVRKKAHLVIRMLENRLGKELLLQVFNKLLSLAASATKGTAGQDNMLVSSSSFQKAVFLVTGKEIGTFIEHWVRQGGHAKFVGHFSFNRKRNTVELEIRQPDVGMTGVKKYNGPLIIAIQELDGTFRHTLQIEEISSKHDITCHSKSRRNKKKKIPLATGEEVDMDLSAMDLDSPVLWLRLDPDMLLLRQGHVDQQDFHWRYQLRYERDITAQLLAIKELSKMSSNDTRIALTEIIENEQCFYRVRCAAAFCLQQVANTMQTWPGPLAMIGIFRKLYGSYASPSMVKQNNFSNFQQYFLQQAIPKAMAGLRTVHRICPPEVLAFLLDLFKYNENSKNRYSDCYYRRALIDALAETVTPVVSVVLNQSSSKVMVESMSEETKSILEEVTRCLNLEKLLPGYKLVCTIGCLFAIRRLQKMGHIPNSAGLFQDYASVHQFEDVRMAALEMLVDYTSTDGNVEDLNYLLDVVENDPLPRVRLHVLRALTSNPPFSKRESGTHSSAFNSDQLVERLWTMMNSKFSHDSKLRCALVDLYHVLYGRGRPQCLPMPELGVVFNLREKRAQLNASTIACQDEVGQSSPPIHFDRWAAAADNQADNEHDDHLNVDSFVPSIHGDHKRIKIDHTSSDSFSLPPISVAASDGQQDKQPLGFDASMFPHRSDSPMSNTVSDNGGGVGSGCGQSSIGSSSVALAAAGNIIGSAAEAAVSTTETISDVPVDATMIGGSVPFGTPLAIDGVPSSGSASSKHKKKKKKKDKKHKKRDKASLGDASSSQDKQVSGASQPLAEVLADVNCIGDNSMGAGGELSSTQASPSSLHPQSNDDHSNPPTNIPLLNESPIHEDI
ncbi:transcription initiation factor TFIID subunit 2-like isoform X2 [Varroa jacobsoni]|uniref:transcription initiation factor TFIID subunit 2-like isoform X2 n=1 Tax=Varroa jacobsoni TaxID=62625 RepID=UPI000BF75E50|nr:transcription initiation factor TFIID subunit 2-like isoform X2 [Varroa jacobsoni]